MAVLEPGEAAWQAEIHKPVSQRQIFKVSEVAFELARLPGRLESEPAERRRIENDLWWWFGTGEFGDDEVLDIVDQPPYFVPLKPLLEQALLHHPDAYVPWNDAILTRSAIKKYLKRRGLDGAPRLLTEWFADDAAGRTLPGSADTQSLTELAANPEKPEGHTGHAKKRKKPRRDEKRSAIVLAIDALFDTEAWKESRDKARCRLVNQHLNKSEGWCTVSTLRRACSQRDSEQRT